MSAMPAAPCTPKSQNLQQAATKVSITDCQDQVCPCLPHLAIHNTPGDMTHFGERSGGRFTSDFGYVLVHMHACSARSLHSSYMVALTSIGTHEDAHCCRPDEEVWLLNIS